MGAIRDLLFGEGASMVDASAESTTFAAQRIDRSRSSILETSLRHSWAGATDTEVWDIYDEIGEVRNAVAKQGRIAGHVVFGIYRRSPDGIPTRIRNDELPEACADTLAALRLPRGGSRGLVQRYYEQIRVGGFLELQAVRQAGKIRALHLRSAKEVERRGDPTSNPDKIEYVLKRSVMHLRTRGSWADVQVGNGGAGWSETKISREDMLGQIWAPHPLYYDVPQSALWSMRTTALNLISLQDAISTRINSRNVMSGIHAFKRGTIIDVPPTAPEYVRNGDNVTRLAWTMRQSVDDPTSQSRLVGLVVEAEEDPKDVYYFHDGMRALLEGDMDAADRLLHRLITGMDVQEGTVVGRTEANHFSAWADDADEMRSNIVPTLEDFYAGLTSLVLWPMMTKNDKGVEGDIEDYFVWGDLTSAQTTVNQPENIRQGVAAGAVKKSAMARAAGVGDDMVTDDDDMVRYIGEKIGDPYLALHGIIYTLTPDEIKERVKAHEASKTGPAGDVVDSSRPKSQPGTGDPGSPGDDRSDRRGRSAPVK